MLFFWGVIVGLAIGIVMAMLATQDMRDTITELGHHKNDLTQKNAVLMGRVREMEKVRGFERGEQVKVDG